MKHLLLCPLLLAGASAASAQICNVANPSFSDAGSGWLALGSTGGVRLTENGPFTDAEFTNAYERVTILEAGGQQRTALAFGTVLPDGGAALTALIGNLSEPVNKSQLPSSENPFETFEPENPSASIGQTGVRLLQPGTARHVALRLDYIGATFGEAFECLEVRVAAYGIDPSYLIADATESFLATDVVTDPTEWQAPRELWVPAVYPRTDLQGDERSLGWRTVEVGLDLGDELLLDSVRFEFQIQARNSRNCAPRAEFASVIVDDVRLRVVSSSTTDCAYGPSGASCAFQIPYEVPPATFNNAEVFWQPLDFAHPVPADRASSEDMQRVDTVEPAFWPAPNHFPCELPWDVRLTAASVSKLPSALLGDLNNDDRVDGADLGLLMAAFGSNGGPADLNVDGVVNGADQGLLLAGWTGGGCQ